MIAESSAILGGVGTRILTCDGPGTPIVLLHGYADSADTWRPVLSRLAMNGRHALAIDLPGFGHADARPPGPLLPQFDAFADAVLSQFGPAILVGNSLGAATAVRAASRNHVLVRALMTLDDPLNAHHWLARLAGKQNIPTGFWLRVGRLPISPTALRWATRRVVPKVLYGPGAPVDPQVVAYWSQLLSRTADVAMLGRDAFRYAHEALGAHRDVQVTCPTVIVHGKRDRIIGVHSSHILHQQIPSSELVILPQSGHCPQLDNPDEVTRLIVELWNRTTDATSATK